MSISPQRPGGASTTSTMTKIVPLKGLFADGVWHCNCYPRLPAAQFQVKKEGPNTSRWFYTCQEPKGSDCGFFLWADEAVSREMRAVIHNTRSEPEPSRTPVEPAKDRRTVQGHIEASNNWIADLGKAEEEEFGDWPLSADEEKIAGPLLPVAFPVTPHKAVKTDIFTTPGSKRKRDAETLPTPATKGNRGDDIFTSPPTVRPRDGMWDSNDRFGPSLRSPSETPTPNRFRDASEAIDIRAEGPSQSYDIADEVFDVLNETKLDDETRVNLEQLLARHALRISGIAKGRDITRAALKVKEERIAELQEKVGRLEVERELDKTIIRHFKSDVAYSVAKTGRGRRRGNGT